MVDRKRRLSLLISDDEHRLLQEVAEERGLTASDVVRQFIRAEHARLFGEAKRQEKRRRKR